MAFIATIAGFIVGVFAGRWAGKKVLASHLHKVADMIDKEHPPPHFDGTLGKMHADFATQLRELARKIGGERKV